MQKKWIGMVGVVLLLGVGVYGTNRPEHKVSPAEPLTEKVAETVRQIKQAGNMDKSARLTPEEETQRLLKEAANKRFKVDRPAGMLTEDRDVAEDLTRQVAVEMLLETLIREKIDKNPEYVQETETRMMTREPRLLTLQQNDSTGEQRSVQVLVADTRSCRDRMAQNGPFEVQVADLESDFCMHPTLEYPGGFDPARPLQLIVGSITDKGKFADIDRQWDRLLKIELRQAITAEFVPRYKSTGTLTL